MQYSAESITQAKNVPLQKGSGGLMRRAQDVLDKKKPAALPVILDEGGIFTIRGGIETDSVRLDPGLKELVDSVVFRRKA